MKVQRLAVVLIVGVVVVSTGAGVLLYLDGSDIGSNSQSNSNSTGDDVAVLNQSSDGKVYLDVASDPQRDRADLGHALDGLYDEKSINVSNINVEANTIAIATDGRSNATYIANWIEQHLDHPQANADSDSSTDSETASPQAQCGVEPTYYQIDFVAGEPIEELQGPKGTYTPDELIRFAHSNSEKSDIRRSSNGEFTTNESLRNAVDSKSIHVEDGTAKVSFSISEDSAPVKLTLASYTKPQRIWTRATEHQQEFVDADTQTFEPGGSYTLSVDLPDSKVVPCETDTAPDQPDSSTETDIPESPGTPQSSTPAGTSETATSDTTPETTEAAPGTPETATSDTTTAETTSGTITAETTNPGTTDAPPTTTTTPPTETTSADLGVRKTVDDANATVGENVTFTIDVTNNGPDAASNVSVDEMLGSGLEYQSGEVSQGIYDPVTGVYNVDTLANGETATLEITATIKNSDNTTNAVKVTSDQPDPNPPNNNDSANPTPSVGDLSLTKNVNESAPNVGDNVKYTLILSNDGPNATLNVSVTDTLPDGLSYVNSDASQGEYNNGTGLWTVDSLSDSGEATLTIVATVESSDDVTNIAEVNSSDTFDPDSTPNNDDPDEDDRGSTTIDGQSSDLSVTKTVNDSNVTVGDTVEFTVEVTNNGPDAATNVSVNESLGNGFEFQNASVTQGGYDANTGVYAVGTLDSNETATLALTARINSTDNTTNAVEVTGDQPDPTDPNNNDSANPTPAVADLSLTKNVNKSTPDVGANVEYTLTLSNDGPNATSNVTVTDALPDGMSFVSSDASQGEYNNGTGLWTVNSIANDSEATLSVVATVESTDDVTNVAEVNSSDTFDPDSTPSNDNPDEDDRGSTTINGQSADLTVSKTVNETNVTVGDTVDFTVEVTNNGPDAATNVAVDEKHGTGLEFQSATVSQGSYDNETNTYDVGTLGSGETATLTLTATIESADDTANAAEVTSDTPDPNPPNNDSVDPSPSVADLSLTKSVNETSPNVGDTVEYTLTLANDGPNATSNVTVTDSLPDGLSGISTTASQGSYDTDSGLWTVGELASGERSTLTITATIQSTTDVTNIAEVNSSDTFDPNSTPNNNESGENDQDNSTVNGQSADLAVSKSVDDSDATVGDNVTFSVDVTNTGPDTARNVVVDDTLPAGLTFQDASATQGEYDQSSGTYNVGDLENGETATLTLTATIDSTDASTLENVATGTSDTFDPDESNNEDSATPSPQVANLSLSKSVNESAPALGNNVEYTVTLSNDGPNNATNVNVTETLPDGLEFVSSDASQGSYDSASGLWTVSEVAGDDEATLSIVATVNTTDNVVNTAEVNSSDQFDPNSTPDNNEPSEDDQDNATVNGQSADLAVNKTVEDVNATVGDDVTFTIDVTNNGPDTATNVSAYETLDSGLSFVDASATQGEYNADTGVYSVGSLANGDTATLTLTATIESPNNTTNAVEVTSETPDPNEPNNNDTVDPSPTVSDLSINKTVDDSNATVGDDVTFTVDVTNEGPDTATNVSVNEALGEGLSFVEADTTKGEYDAAAGVYNVGTLENDETATLTLTATIESADNTTNAVNVTGDPFDPNDPNNNETVDPSPQVADLNLTKSVNESAPALGSNVEYTLTLSNDGPNTATGVEVTDALPDGLSLVSADPNTGSYDSGVWTVNELATGEQTTLTLTTTVENTEDVMNTAEVTASDQFDPDSTPGNNVSNEDDQANTTVSGQAADLAVTKTVDDSEPTVGDDVTFTVDVTNNGPTTATNVSVDESLGDGLSFQSATVSQGSYDEGTNVYDVGTLDSGETATLTLTATIDNATDTTNAVEVTGDQPDPNDPNNNDSVTPTPTAADLSLNKTVNESAPQTGAGIAYTLELTNDGPNATSNVAVGDTLPNGVTFVGADASQGSYDDGTGVWSVGDVEEGGTKTLTINATVDSAGSQTNTAQVTSSSTFDPDSTPGNDDGKEDDQDSVTTQSTTPQCSVQMSNASAPDSVAQGQQAKITADITNTGLANDCGATATLNASGNSTRAVDIVFLVDTSASTEPYIDQIANQLNGFADDLSAQNIDARYAVVSYGGYGYVNTDQKYTSNSQDAINALNGLRSSGSQERNYAAIQQALNLDSRANANTFLIDVTDEDTDRHSGDPTKTEITNQIDDAGASFIAVSPGKSGVDQPDLGMETLSEEVRNGHWVNLFTDSGDLNNFVSGFQDIVVNQVEEGINRDTSVTLDAGESRTLSFTVDTSPFQAGSELDYTVTVGSETQTGTITITPGSTSTSINAASVDDSSSTSNTARQDTTNETTVPPEMTESSSENTSKTTTATETPTTETSTKTATTETETETETAADDPTETVDTTTETPTVTKTETAAEAAETPTEASAESTMPMVNTTVEASSNMTDETSPTANETPSGTENTTAAS